MMTLTWSLRISPQEVLFPPTTGLHAGDVYYVSKRNICSRSVAYEQLEIQPIAISKVILRPVVRTERTDNLDNRLEVLENPMINDVVFLDMGVTGKEAELNANLCPLHTVSTLPERAPKRYTASSVLFGIVVSAHEIPQLLLHLNYWAPDKDVELYILLPYEDSHRTAEATRLIRETLGKDVVVESAPGRMEPSLLTLVLLQRMQKYAISQKEWFIILTPDTFVTSMRDVLLALEPYDSGDVLYMGGLSESAQQKEKYGIFPYPGAGIVLSRPLVTELEPYSSHPDLLETDLSSRVFNYGGHGGRRQSSAKVYPAPYPNKFQHPSHVPPM